MALWKEIAGYEGMYLISDKGEVISLPRTVKCGDKTLHRKSKPIKTHWRGREKLKYEAVSLSKDGTRKTFSVHRLVANAFLPNPENLPEVNHKDGNTFNNAVENLEWCSHQYNIEYSKNKPVAQIKDGIVLAVFKSIKEAGKQTGIKRTGINNVVCGIAKIAGGFNWKYCDC